MHADLCGQPGGQHGMNRRLSTTVQRLPEGLGGLIPGKRQAYREAGQSERQFAPCSPWRRGMPPSAPVQTRPNPSVRRQAESWPRCMFSWAAITNTKQSPMVGRNPLTASNGVSSDQREAGT